MVLGAFREGGFSPGCGRDGGGRERWERVCRSLGGGRWLRRFWDVIDGLVVFVEGAVWGWEGLNGWFQKREGGMEIRVCGSKLRWKMWDS